MLKREDAVLVVIDVQERLLPLIHESEALVEQIVRLIRGFQILGSPILVTEQYRKGLGLTDPRIVEAISHPLPPAGESVTASGASPPGGSPSTPPSSGGFEAIEKMTFSCAAHAPFLDRLKALRRKQVVLCGIETQVCVWQTALQLLEGRFEVYLAADAVSSRTPRNIEIALRRMEKEGVRLTSVEMAVFEMLHLCGTPEFKRWIQVIR